MNEGVPHLTTNLCVVCVCVWCVGVELGIASKHTPHRGYGFNLNYIISLSTMQHTKSSPFHSQ